MSSKFGDFAMDVLSRYSLATNFWSTQGKILAQLKQENKELLNQKALTNKKDDKIQEASEIDDYLAKLDSEIKFRRKNDRKDFVGNLDLKLRFLIEHSFRCLKEIRNKIPNNIFKRNSNALKQIEEKVNSLELLDTSEKIDLLEKCEILKLCLLRELNYPWKVVSNLKEAAIEGTWNLIEISNQIENLENSDIAKAISEKSEILATNNAEKISEFLVKVEKLKSEALKLGEISHVNDDRTLTDLRRITEKTQDSLSSLVGSDDEEVHRLSSTFVKLNDDSEEILNFHEAQINKLVLEAKNFKNSAENVEITKSKFLSKIQQHLCNSMQSLQSLSSITYQDPSLNTMEKEISRGSFKSLFKLGKLQESIRRGMISSLPEYGIDMKSLSNLLKMLKSMHRSVLEMSNRLKIKNEELLEKIEDLNEGYESTTLKYEEVAAAEKKYKLVYVQAFQKTLGESWGKHLEIIDALIRYIPYMDHSIGDLLSFGSLVKESESTLRMLMELFTPKNKKLFGKLEQLLNKKVEIDANLFKINEADMLASQWKTIENYFTSSRDLIFEEEMLKQELIKFSEPCKEKFELMESLKKTYEESLELSKRVLELGDRIEKELVEYMNFWNSYKSTSLPANNGDSNRNYPIPSQSSDHPLSQGSYKETPLSESLKNFHGLQSRLLDNFESQNKIYESVVLAQISLQESPLIAQNPEQNMLPKRKLVGVSKDLCFFIKGNSKEALLKLISLIHSSETLKPQGNRALIVKREPLIVQGVSIILMILESIQGDLLSTFESKINFIQKGEIKENALKIIEFIKQLKLSPGEEPFIKILNNIFQWKEKIQGEFMALFSKLLDANLEVKEEIIIEEIQPQTKIPAHKKAQKVRSRKRPDKESDMQDQSQQSEAKPIEKPKTSLIPEIEEGVKSLYKDCYAILNIINPGFEGESFNKSIKADSEEEERFQTILNNIKSSGRLLDTIKNLSKDVYDSNSSYQDLKSQLNKLEKLKEDLTESQKALEDKDFSIKSLREDLTESQKALQGKDSSIKSLKEDLTEFQKALEDKDSSIKSLKEDLTESQKALQGKDSSIKSLKEDLAESQKVLQSKESSIQSLKESFSALEKENKNWIEMYTSLNKIINEREEEWSQEKSKFEQISLSQNETIISLDKEITNLNKKIEKQAEELSILEEENQKLNEELSRLEGLRNKEDTSETEEIVLHQEEVFRITESINILDNEIVTLEDEIENRDSLIQEQSETIQSHKAERISFDEAISTQAETITQLNDEIYNLKEVIQKQEEIISIHEEENDELKAIIQKKDEENAIINSSLTKLNEDFNQARKEWKIYEDSAKDLELKLQIATTNLSLEAMEARRLKDDISSLKIKIASDENLQPILQIKEEQIEDLNMQLSNLQNCQKLLDEARNELWTRNRQLEIDNENLNREKSELKLQVKIFKNDRNEAESDRKVQNLERGPYSEESSQDIETLNSKLNEESEIISNLETQISGLLQKESEYKTSIRNLFLRILRIRALYRSRFIIFRRFNQWQDYAISSDIILDQFSPEVPSLTLTDPEVSAIQISKNYRESNTIDANEEIAAKSANSPSGNLI
ncbi:unnamed protein product [Blepharisma stoltei]|uniref:Uncharacterized protein n=1 Tax=Blepharisma stoltei TaxID=1481888 RepID=A0AAU9J5Y3_9CILI|nr:unnamed protein product [Blepharisma stoltei]